MRAILGLLPPTAGHVRVFDHAPQRGNPAIGYVPQTRTLLSDSRVRGLDLIASSVRGERWGVPSLRRADHELIDETLAAVGARELAKHPLSAMSGAERQRIILAQAMLDEPRLLLLFFGQHAHLAEPKAFAAYLAPLRKIEWYLYLKSPFGGPEAVLAYLSRYTHRVAIANSRLIAFDENGVTFRYKDYRADGRARYKTMTLATDEFIRRFLIHVLPHGFHRIRHYGLFANGNRAANIHGHASCSPCRLA